MRISTGVLVAAMFVFSGCSTWSTSSVDKTTASAVRSKPKDFQSVIITEDDITDRKYEVLGDVTATVRKTTILNADPTEAHVQEQLRKKAAQMGADAVILVRYGTVGIGLNSWGVLEGKGRAVRFVN